MRTIRAAAGLVHDATAAAVLTRGGSVLPVPGLPTHRVLAANSPALDEAAERLDAGDAYAAFLYPAPDSGPGPGALLRVSVLDCPGEGADHLRALLLVSPAAEVRGLSHRALRILGLVIEDWPDERIAVYLATTVQDVAGCIRRCMHLLAAPSRTALAVRALREGLFLPRRTVGGAA
jgi:DNA-binding CsgD family transcriptional regulator